MRAAFVSRHAPTPSQIEMASAQGVELIHVGDRDGFVVTWNDLGDASFGGVVVVHAAAALRLAAHERPVGIFENANRAPPGAHPTFEPVRLHWFKFESDGYAPPLAFHNGKIV